MAGAKKIKEIAGVVTKPAPILANGPIP